VFTSLALMSFVAFMTQFINPYSALWPTARWVFGDPTSDELGAALGAAGFLWYSVVLSGFVLVLASRDRLPPGAAGLLVWSEVFRAIPEPWFVHGRYGEWNAGEDIIFCEQANEAGFDIFVDLAAQLGHLCASAIWPSWIDQEWAVGFSVADGLRLYCPIEKPAEAEEAAPADAVRR